VEDASRTSGDVIRQTWQTMKEFKVFVISHLRSANVKQIEAFLGITPVWVVGKGEQSVYTAQGASETVEGGELVASRNKALEIAFKEDCVCVQVSDDIKKIQKIIFPKKTVSPITFQEVLDIFRKEIWHSPFYLYGVPPTANAFYVHKSRSLNNFIIGDFMVIKPNPLRFDPEFLLKEDYDYNAQHIKKYGGILRFNDILFTFKHYSNKGGVVSYRNEELEAEMAQNLLKKHPQLFRLNKRRKNEVLLKSPRSK